MPLCAADHPFVSRLRQNPVLEWICGDGDITRDGFRKGGALRHLCFWGPHAGETYLCVCLKSVKTGPSYV